MDWRMLLIDLLSPEVKTWSIIRVYEGTIPEGNCKSTSSAFTDRTDGLDSSRQAKATHKRVPSAFSLKFYSTKPLSASS